MQTDLLDLASKVAGKLTNKKLKLATAESCTGGQLAYVLTSISGSSHWFDRGFITYSNESKHEMLGVDLDIINQYGAVSTETVQAMAKGAILHSQAQVAVAITGIAGPSGGSREKPVGTVWIAWILQEVQTKVQRFYFVGDRKQIRTLAVFAALKEINQLI